MSNIFSLPPSLSTSLFLLCPSRPSPSSPFLPLPVPPSSEVDSFLYRLSVLLTVHTSKFNVLISPLSATVLEVIPFLSPSLPSHSLPSPPLLYPPRPLSVSLSVYGFFCLFIYLSSYVSVCLSVSLSVC